MQDAMDGLKSFIPDALQTFGVPGAAVTVVRDDEIVFAEGFGKRNHRDPVTAGTLFRIGSVHKSITSMLVAILVDAGVLAWDQRVVTIYPEFRLSDEALTQAAELRDLLTMRLGLGATSFSYRCADTITRRLFQYLPQVPVVAGRGERFIYHDDIYAAAGFIAAMATGAKLDTAMDAYQMLVYRHILMPIGMKDATFVARLDTVCEDAALSYEVNLATGRLDAVEYTDIGSLTPSGGLAASINDMARYLITHLRGGLTLDGKRIVSAESLSQTHQPQIKVTDNLHYGMGWTVMDRGEYHICWHNGGIDGFCADIAFIPEYDAGLVVMSNASTGLYFNQAILKAFIEVLHGREANAGDVQAAYNESQKVYKRLRADAPPLTEEDVAGYVGDYEHYLSVELRDDNTLWLKTWSNTRQLLPIEKGRYILSLHVEPHQVTFTPSKNGGMQMSFISLQSGEELYGTYQKIPTVKRGLGPDKL